MANPSEIYRITFLNKGKVYEVFAKQVYQSELYGSSKWKTTSSTNAARSW